MCSSIGPAPPSRVGRPSRVGHRGSPTSQNGELATNYAVIQIQYMGDAFIHSCVMAVCRTSDFHSRPTSGRLTFQSRAQRESLLTVDGDQVVYQKYKWTKEPSLWSKCMDIPNSFMHFLQNLANAFGWKFVIMVGLLELVSLQPSCLGADYITNLLACLP